MVGTALPILSSLAPMLLDTQAESSRAGKAINGRSAFTVWKRLYLLRCHITRIREALQAVSSGADCPSAPKRRYAEAGGKGRIEPGLTSVHFNDTLNTTHGSQILGTHVEQRIPGLMMQTRYQ